MLGQDVSLRYSTRFRFVKKRVIRAKIGLVKHMTEKFNFENLFDSNSLIRAVNIVIIFRLETGFVGKLGKE